jgi:Ser/Thr protein kinase RdoA (MazF antagonist)
MNFFPVSASTLSDFHLGNFIKERYSVLGGTMYSVKLFRTGINHTYIVYNLTSKYVFRVYCHNWRTVREIQAELDLILSLHQEGLNVSYPIPDETNTVIHQLNAPEGIRYGVMFSFAQGDKVRFKSITACKNIGNLMAKMHKVTKNKTNNRISYNAKTLLQDPYTLALQYFDKSLPEMQYLKNITHNLQDVVNLAAENTGSGIVHMDIWYDNMSIRADNITLFDFDFCGNGPLILDVAYFCNQLFNIETDKAEYEQKVSSFIEGYNEVRKLSDDDIKLIPQIAPAIFIFYLGVQCIRFDWSNIFLSENYLKMYTGRIKAWIDYCKAKENQLL